MIQKLKQFLKKHENIFFVKSALNIKHTLEENGAKKRLKRLQKIHVPQNRKVRVIFIVIDKNTWNKAKPLYFEMLQSDKIEVNIVCCPQPFKGDTAGTYNYFVQQGYDCIDARVGNGPWNAMEKQGKWFNIKKLKPDYVFYNEPYNGYLPPKYRSNVTSGYAKVCIVAYGMTTTQNFLEIRPHDFYRDVYIFYANNRDEYEYNIAQFKKQHELKIQHTKYLGFLGKDNVLAKQNEKAEAWNFSKNKVRAIWTPRWTLDEKVGGSNFFRYKNVLFEYADSNQDVDFLFRPHPMALDNFIRTGKMTQAEVDNFINHCANVKNISLDSQGEYISSFWQSSFLITDISSIIIEYFITGKPIVFCRPENNEQVYLPFFSKILDACYVVNNKEELLVVLDYLASGEDEKKNAREKLLNEILGNKGENVSSAILNDILNDAKGNYLYK